MLPWYPIIQIPHIYIITVIGETEHPYRNTYSAPMLNILGGIIMMDKFNRSTVTSKNSISNNKIAVTIERFPQIKGTEIEKTLRTLTAIIEEANRHIDSGDNYFDYSNDSVKAEVRISILISDIYMAEGDAAEIIKSIGFKTIKAGCTELSDHYWAINYNK